MTGYAASLERIWCAIVSSHSARRAITGATLDECCYVSGQPGDQHPPGPYEIRVVGDATTGHRGSVFTFVTIPDFAHDALTLSGVALSASASGPTVPADFLSDVLPFVPTSRRTFARTERLSLLARVSRGGTRAEPVAVHTWIADREDRTVADDRRTLGREAFATSRTADVGLELPLAQFLPGDYMLVIDAAAGEKSQRRQVRFSVQ